MDKLHHIQQLYKEYFNCVMKEILIIHWFKSIKNSAYSLMDFFSVFNKFYL